MLLYARKSSKIRHHNPEVVGSSPASATIKNSRFHKKTAVFLTFWWLQKLRALRLGVYLGFTPVVDSSFLTFGPKMIFGVKQHFWEKVPESFIQNGKTPFSLYNSVEYSEYSRLFDILERWNLEPWPQWDYASPLKFVLLPETSLSLAT